MPDETPTPHAESLVEFAPPPELSIPQSLPDRTESPAAPVAHEPASSQPVSIPVSQHQPEAESVEPDLGEYAGLLDTLPPMTPEPPKPEDLAAQIRALEARLETPQQVPQAIPAAPSGQPEAFVTPEQYEDLFSGHQNFNTFLSDFKAKTKTETIQEILPVVAQVAMNASMQQVAAAQATEAFFREYPQIEPHRQYAATVYGQLNAQHPDWPVKKLLEASAKLTLAKVAKEAKQAPMRAGNPTTVPFAPVSSVRPNITGPKQQNGLMAELAAIRL